MNLRKYLQRLNKAVRSPFQAKGTAIYTLFLSIFSFISLVLGSNPQYTIQILSFDIAYLGEAIKVISLNIIKTNGILGLGLISTYSILIGITIVNFYSQIRNQGFGNLRELSGILPGFLVAGCAGCGVGLLSFVGLAGVATTFPFGGNLVRIGGILLMLAILANSGDPKTCSIPS